MIHGEMSMMTTAVFEVICGGYEDGGSVLVNLILNIVMNVRMFSKEGKR
jgi:hypothetical protein